MPSKCSIDKIHVACWILRSFQNFSEGVEQCDVMMRDEFNFMKANNYAYCMPKKLYEKTWIQTNITEFSLSFAMMICVCRGHNEKAINTVSYCRLKF